MKFYLVYSHAFRILLLFMSLTALPALISTDASAAGAIDPLEYPHGKIGNSTPPFLWQDLYGAGDRGAKVQYRLTLKKDDAGKDSRMYLFNPVQIYGSISSFRIPEPLGEGSWEYTIERLLEGSPVRSRYYHYRRYPVRGSFVLNLNEVRKFERLETRDLAKYLLLERDNRLNNGYNSLFFAGSATFSLGAGILFYKVINLGVWSTVISWVCFSSAAVGYGASGYYGYSYLEGKSELGKIVDIGTRTSLNGGHRDGKFDFSANLKF